MVVPLLVPAVYMYSCLHCTLYCKYGVHEYMYQRHALCMVFPCCFSCSFQVYSVVDVFLYSNPCQSARSQTWRKGGRDGWMDRQRRSHCYYSVKVRADLCGLTALSCRWAHETSHQRVTSECTASAKTEGERGEKGRLEGEMGERLMGRRGGVDICYILAAG